MTPVLVTKVAIRIYSKRWVAFACTIAGFGAFAACAAYGTPVVARLAGALAGPAVGIPWAMFCAASWFHPEHGSMARLGRAGFLPDWLQQLVRWYGAMFLAVFVLFCAVAWPAFAYSDLWPPVQ